jgi:hypothetical protein
MNSASQAQENADVIEGSKATLTPKYNQRGNTRSQS